MVAAMRPIEYATASLMLLSAVTSCASSGANPPTNSPASMSPASVEGAPARSDAGNDRQEAQNLVRSAKDQLTRCGVDKASAELDRAFAVYERHGWTADADYAQAVVTRGRLRQLRGDDDKAVADLAKGMAMLGEPDAESLSSFLQANGWLAQAFSRLDDRSQQRTTIEHGLDAALRRLPPVGRASSAELRVYLEVLSLLQSHALIADGSTALAWQTKFQARVWKWGAPWGPVPASSRAKKGEPLCTTPHGTTPFLAKTDDAMERVRGDFKRCFESAAAKDPKVRGPALLVGRLAADGSVDSLRGISIGLDAASTGCMTRAFEATHFMPPPERNTLPTLIAMPAIFAGTPP